MARGKHSTLFYASSNPLFKKNIEEILLLSNKLKYNILYLVTLSFFIVK